MVGSTKPHQGVVGMLYIAVVPSAPAADPVSPKAATVARFYAAIQAGEYEVLRELLTPDAVTRWPQSGEQITGAMACIRVRESYPGGEPPYRVQGIVGGGDVWVAELIADYGTERWYA